MNVKPGTTYSRQKLSLLYDMVQNVVQQEVKKSFKRLGGIALTTGVWASRSNDGYMSLTNEFTNNNFHFKDFLVG